MLQKLVAMVNIER